MVIKTEVLGGSLEILDVMSKEIRITPITIDGTGLLF